MKKTFRILVPILMTAAILLCLGWYFFIYDTALTRDILLDGARYFESNGNHNIASSLYDLAYKQTSDNEDVAIELAKYHIKSGNFTQAENTLSSAIADGGNEDLYIALCQTYLQQDKILDAISLLDNITNPAIKAKLDAMRPVTPKASVEPGFYSQYISVGILSEGNAIYVTTDGEYPSVQNAPYENPVELHDGENTIYAVAVAENGLVSPMAIFGYTVGGVIEQVKFEDSAIEAQVRTILEKSEDAILYSNDLWDITSFVIPEGTQTLNDLSKMIFLQDLTIDQAPQGQLLSISGLANLQKLTITNTPVTSDEVDVIGKLPMLESLTMRECSLSTIAGLQNAEKLTYLDLSKNTLRNISVLSSLKNMKELNLESNVVEDLSALSPMVGLTKLNVSFNALSSLSPIAELAQLNIVDAQNNKLTSLPNLSKLTNLQEFNVAYNSIGDVSTLSACTKLVRLDISNNTLTDISALGVLENMTDFNFEKNQVSALPSWSENSKLVNINGSYNLLTDLSPLKDMKELNKVYVDYNPELEDIELLNGCSRLVLVNAYGTKVQTADTLIKLGVVVNYNPTDSEQE